MLHLGDDGLEGFLAVLGCADPDVVEHAAWVAEPDRGEVAVVFEFDEEVADTLDVFEVLWWYPIAFHALGPHHGATDLRALVSRLAASLAQVVDRWASVVEDPYGVFVFSDAYKYLGHALTIRHA